MKISLYDRSYVNKSKKNSLNHPFVRMAISMGMMAALTGCSITTQVWDRDPKRIKPQNLNIVRGQPLQIYFQKLSYLSQKNTDIEAWRSTQLFSSVTETPRDQPSAYGYFLRVDCKHSSSRREDDDLVYMMLELLSAFIIPYSELSSKYCVQTMYENGIEIASDKVDIKYRTWSSGWVLLPQYLTRDSLYAIHAQTVANIRVRSMMSTLTEENK